MLILLCICSVCVACPCGGDVVHADWTRQNLAFSLSLSLSLSCACSSVSCTHTAWFSFVVIEREQARKGEEEEGERERERNGIVCACTHSLLPVLVKQPLAFLPFTLLSFSSLSQSTSLCYRIVFCEEKVEIESVCVCV